MGTEANLELKKSRRKMDWFIAFLRSLKLPRTYLSPTASRDCFAYDDPENRVEEVPEISQIQVNAKKYSFNTSFIGTAMCICRKSYAELMPYGIVDNFNKY